MSAWAKPGVKCVCVDDSRGNPIPGFTVITSGPGIVAGETYVIREIWRDPDLGCLLVALEGHIRPRCPRLKREGGWRISRFRPLITKSQDNDVALFRHLLASSPVDAGLVPAGVELGA